MHGHGSEKDSVSGNDLNREVAPRTALAVNTKEASRKL
jgi:hypothetical protein